MKSAALIWLLLSVTSQVERPPGPDEVDTAAILRLGDMVQRVGDGIRSADADTLVEAMALPADDSGKWFVSVVSRRDCAPCAALKKQWIGAAERRAAGAEPLPGDDYLLAIADPVDDAKSWSHFNIYDHGDKLQKWRFEGVKITSYPTIILQPPRNKNYGDPSTVVYLAPYPGNPQKMAAAITAAMRLYLSKPRIEATPPTPPTPSNGIGQLFDSLDLSPDVIPPLPSDVPTIPPTIPANNPPPVPGSPPTPTDEIVIVTDAADGGDPLDDPRIRRGVAALQRNGGPVRRRFTDWQEAHDKLPIQRDELPAIVRIKGGKVVDKLSAGMLDMLTDPGFPWTSIAGLVASLFTGSFSWVALAGVAFVLYRYFQGRTPTNPDKPGPSPILDPAIAAQIEKRLLELVGKLTAGGAK